MDARFAESRLHVKLASASRDDDTGFHFALAVSSPLDLLTRLIVRVDRQSMHRGSGLLDQLVIGREAFMVHPVFELLQVVHRRRQFGESGVELG